MAEGTQSGDWKRAVSNPVMIILLDIETRILIVMVVPPYSIMNIFVYVYTYIHMGTGNANIFGFFFYFILLLLNINCSDFISKYLMVASLTTFFSYNTLRKRINIQGRYLFFWEGISTFLVV